MNSIRIRPLPAAAALLSVVFLILYTAGSSADDERSSGTELKTEIVQATVYGDYGRGEVRIIRHGSIRVEPGIYRFVAGVFPRRIDESSVQVEGSGTASAEITGINVRYAGEGTEKPDKYRELNERLEMLKSKKDSLQIRKNSLSKRLKFLSAITEFNLGKANEQLSEESFGVEDWKGILDFIEGENNRIKSSISGLGKKLAAVEEQINEVSGKIRMMSIDKSGKEVEIDCEIKSAGVLTFRITYLTREAAWRPGYTIRYHSSAGIIDLSYQALVIQGTGEEWDDVTVTLSTARPHLGAGPPELHPVFLKRRKLVRVGGGRRSSIQTEDALSLKAGTVKDADELHVRGGRAEEAEVSFTQARTERSGFSANFRIGTPVSLSSGSRRRILVKRAELPVQVSLYSAPRLSPHVFATGSLTNTMDIPILKGMAGVYIQASGDSDASPVSTFVGKDILKDVSPGGKADFYLGMDQDVKVNHQLIKKEYLSEEGDRRTEIRYHYLISAENFKEREVRLRLKDRLPVSVMDDIDIYDVDIDPGADSRGENGILTWNLRLQPKEKAEILLEYSVRFPGEWPEHTIMHLE